MTVLGREGTGGGEDGASGWLLNWATERKNRRATTEKEKRNQFRAFGASGSGQFGGRALVLSVMRSDDTSTTVVKSRPASGLD